MNVGLLNGWHFFNCTNLFVYSPMDDNQDQPIAKETDNKRKVVKDGNLSSQIVVSLMAAQRLNNSFITIVVVKCGFHCCGKF